MLRFLDSSFAVGVELPLILGIIVGASSDDSRCTLSPFELPFASPFSLPLLFAWRLLLPLLLGQVFGALFRLLLVVIVCEG